MISRHICIIILYTVYLLFLEKTWLLNVFTHRLDLLRTKNWPQMRCSCLLPSQTTSITICWKVITDSLMMPAPASTAELELIANCAIIVNQVSDFTLWSKNFSQRSVGLFKTWQFQISWPENAYCNGGLLTFQNSACLSTQLILNWIETYSSSLSMLPFNILPVSGVTGRAFSSFNKSGLCFYSIT